MDIHKYGEGMLCRAQGLALQSNNFDILAFYFVNSAGNFGIAPFCVQTKALTFTASS